MDTRIPSHRRLEGRPYIGAAALLALMACSSSQKNSLVPAFMPAPPAERAIDVSPAHAPAKGTILIKSTGLPPHSTIGIGFGPPNAQYRIIAGVQADADGTVKTEVRVPGWARQGREYVVVIESDTGAPIATSDPIVIAPEGAGLKVLGRFANLEGHCPVVRSAGGKLYALALPAELPFAPGTELEVTGTVAAYALCAYATTLAVEQIKVK